MEFGKAKFFIWWGIALVLNLAIFVVELPEPGLAAPTQRLPLPGLTPFLCM
jgi:hypothetical protein